MADTWSNILSPTRQMGLDRAIADQAAQSAPVIWLIGKVQSGKSSIVQALTGAGAAEVGRGFKACTQASQIFDFPPDAPVVRFLDTRGLGEANYEYAADIAVAERQAHLMLVVMKATDPAQELIRDVVIKARNRHPEWPVLVAQTCLHEAYPPQQDHPPRYPFDENGLPTTALPGDLARQLAWQRQTMAHLPGKAPIGFVPIDFTVEGDGYEPRLFGLEALQARLASIAPAAIIAALQGDQSDQDVRERRAHPHILGYAAAAAATGVLPVAGAVAVPGIQGKLLHSLGEIYDVTWDRRMVGEFAGALGTGTLLRWASTFGARELAKLIPVYGQTAGIAAAAAMSFATTFALGKAATYYLAHRQSQAGDDDGVRRAYEAALQRAFHLARARRLDGCQDASTVRDQPHRSDA